MTPRDLCRTAATLAIGAYAWTCVLVAVVRWELQERRARV